MIFLQGQYHFALSGSYEGSEPTAPNTATPADNWDTSQLQDHQLTQFSNSATDSPNAPTSVGQYYMPQVKIRSNKPYIS